jgi:hypothetical protein
MDDVEGGGGQLIETEDWYLFGTGVRYRR